MGFKGSGAPGQTRTGDPLLRSYAVQNSKCRCWCRLRGHASLISTLNWTEVGLKLVPPRSARSASFARNLTRTFNCTRAASASFASSAARYAATGSGTLRAIVFPGTSDTQHHSENVGAAAPQLAADGIVVRTAYPQVPPKVECRLTPWGQSLCPTLDAILKWADRRPAERRKRNSC